VVFVIERISLLLGRFGGFAVGRDGKLGGHFGGGP